MAAGLTNSRGSAQTQHLPVTELCPAPQYPSGAWRAQICREGVTDHAQCQSQQFSQVLVPLKQLSLARMSLHIPQEGQGRTQQRRNDPPISQAASPAHPQLPEENPPSHHEPSTNSQVLTTAGAAPCPSKPQVPRTIPYPVPAAHPQKSNFVLCRTQWRIYLSFLPSVDFESDPSHLISPA